jgi:hypothetical protein
MVAEGIEDFTCGNEKPKRAKQCPQKKNHRLSADNDPGALVAASAGEKENSGPGSGAPHAAREREPGQKSGARARRPWREDFERELTKISTRSLPREHRRRPGARIVNGA